MQPEASTNFTDTTTSSTLLEAALKYAGRGLAVFPCVATGKKTKSPLTANGFHDASTDAAQIRKWWAKWPDALIGMPTGKVTGRVVLDVDMDEAKKKDGEAALKALLQQHGQELPETCGVRTPRGGRHIYFIHPGVKVPSRTDALGNGLDVRGDGGYVIVPPSQTATGAYAWENEIIDAAPLPTWLCDLMVGDKKFNAKKSSNSKLTPPPPVNPEPEQPQPSSGNLAKLKSALTCIPASDRTVWRDVGFAIKNHLGHAGLKIFDDWSRTAPDSYDADENLTQWNTFKPDGGITIGTVFQMAKQHGWVPERTRTSSSGLRNEYLAGDQAEGASAANSTSLIERLAARIYSPAVKPEEPAPRYSLADVPICTPGNLTTISAPAKAAKTAAVTAAEASGFAAPTADCLGFSSSNPAGHAVLHLDTEQCPFDHWDGVQRMIRRAGVAAAPDWLQSYWLTGFSAQDIRAAIRVLIAQAAEKFGGVHSVFIDGVADAVNDVNDSGETSALVAELHGLAIEFDCPIINVIHVNPGSDFKTRGHLGSQLERKSETNLRLEKDGDGVTVIWADKNRRAPISKATAPRFAWNDNAGMHISVGSLRDAKDEGQKPVLRIEAERVFTTAKATTLTYSKFIGSLMATSKISDSTAKRHLEQMVRTRVVRKNLAGAYNLQK